MSRPTRLLRRNNLASARKRFVREGSAFPLFYVHPQDGFRSFFRRKRRRRPRGENDRETNSVSLKRAPVAGLQANRPRFFTLAAIRFCFRHFHIAGAGRPLACRGNDTATSRVRIRLLRKPKACMIALRKARKKWRRRRERPERVCKKRSLLCLLSEHRRRHPRLFAVLDLLVLLGQAKSTKKNMPVRGTTWSAPQTSLRKFFLLFLSKKEQKKTARRKWSGVRRAPR